MHITCNHVKGLSKLCDKLENDFDVYLRLSVLLYADDAILLSGTLIGFQNQLNVYHKYHKTWHLKVNSNKSKIVIFGKYTSTTNTVLDKALKS